jgi:4-hydroxybenzoate polyprenyltransferase
VQSRLRSVARARRPMRSAPDTYDARVRMRRSVLLGLVAIGALVVLAGIAGIYAVGGRDALGYAVAAVWIVVIVWAVYQWRKRDPNRHR